MTYRTIAATAFLAACAGAVHAQSFAGAEVSAEILAFADDADLGETRYSGGLEFDLWAGLGVAADLAYHGFRGLDADGRSATLHGLYDLGPETTVGVFYANDDVEEDRLDLYGVEGATRMRGVGIEAAIAGYEGDLAAGSLLSLAADYEVGAFAVTGFAGRLGGDVEASRLAIGGEYRIGQGPAIYAEVGRIDVEDASEAYVSLGARLAIGPNRGTTFGSRSVLEVVPGY